MLDRSEPYGQVFGISGVAFEQNGRHFRIDGTPIGDHPPEPEKPAASDADELDGRSSKVLQTMVEQYGGKWRNREHALEFLRGRA
jgi:hypothetical protein